MDLMLDLETLGTETGSIILSIGAALFEPRSYTTPQHTFYTEIDIQSSRDLGLTSSEKTLKWWQDQGHMPQGTTPARSAFETLYQWLIKPPIAFTYLWANSPSFDVALIKAAFKAADLLWPLPYWVERDVRTLKALTFEEDAPLANSHNALEDCKNQITFVQEGYFRLGKHYSTETNPFTTSTTL